MSKLDHFFDSHQKSSSPFRFPSKSFKKPPDSSHSPIKPLFSTPKPNNPTTTTKLNATNSSDKLKSGILCSKTSKNFFKHSNSGHSSRKINHKAFDNSDLIAEPNIVTCKKSIKLPNQEPTRFSNTKNGVVKSYAVNTNQGIVRNYNEDRVSMILNIMKPLDKHENWPQCAFFGVYDGHGGTQCADFLRDNLHHFVVKDPNFPHNPIAALKNGFASAEETFLKKIEENKTGDKSGSCGIVVLIVSEMCYVANVGDSRAVMSSKGGENIIQLSKDHKPMEESEYARILENGGKVYQTKIQTSINIENGEGGFIMGPYRVLPGRLSVSRTFGDIEAKRRELGGNPGVVIAIPDIKAFKVTSDTDFVILASDGIYDVMESKEVIETVWNTSKDSIQDDVQQICADVVEEIMKKAILRRTLDNITVVMIAFASFKNKVLSRKIGEGSVENSKNQRFLLENSILTNSFDLENRSFSLTEDIESFPSKDFQVKTQIPKKNNKISASNSIKSLINISKTNFSERNKLKFDVSQKKIRSKNFLK